MCEAGVSSVDLRICTWNCGGLSNVTMRLCRTWNSTFSALNRKPSVSGMTKEAELVISSPCQQIRNTKQMRDSFEYFDGEPYEAPEI